MSKRKAEDHILDALKTLKKRRDPTEDATLAALKELKGSAGGPAFVEYCAARDAWKQLEDRALEQDLIDLGREDLTLTGAIELLEREGFERYVQGEERKDGLYTLLIVPNPDSDRSACESETGVSTSERVRDFGYELERHETEKDMSGSIGCVLCGGLYTAMAIFEGEKNITKPKEKTGAGGRYFNYLLPRGSATLADGHEELKKHRCFYEF
jgi:hypothetical protein